MTKLKLTTTTPAAAAAAAAEQQAAATRTAAESALAEGTGDAHVVLLKRDTRVQLAPTVLLPVDGGRGVPYALRAVVYHSGVSMHSGHYTACVRTDDGVGEEGVERGCWYYCDDSSVAPVEWRGGVDGGEAAGAGVPYMLVYERVWGPRGWVLDAEQVGVAERELVAEADGVERLERVRVAAWRARAHAHTHSRTRPLAGLSLCPTREPLACPPLDRRHLGTAP